MRDDAVVLVEDGEEGRPGAGGGGAVGQPATFEFTPLIVLVALDDASKPVQRYDARPRSTN